MSGKRLLDAAKLASAGRAVGAKHFDLRRQQWRLWTEGPGLGRAVKSQTDSVTVTAGAAWQLARRARQVKRLAMLQSMKSRLEMKGLETTLAAAVEDLTAAAGTMQQK